MLKQSLDNGVLRRAAIHPQTAMHVPNLQPSMHRNPTIPVVSTQPCSKYQMKKIMYIKQIAAAPEFPGRHLFQRITQRQRGSDAQHLPVASGFLLRQQPARRSSPANTPAPRSRCVPLPAPAKPHTGWSLTQGPYLPARTRRSPRAGRSDSTAGTARGAAGWTSPTRP